MSALSAAAAAIPLETEPARRLRWQTAAVRVAFTWWGVHRTLTGHQKEEVCDAAGADARLLSAGKKIVDVRHEAFRGLTSVRSRIVSHWRGLTLPYVEPGVRLIRQDDVAGFNRAMERYRDELTAAEAAVNEAYEQMKADARRRLGRLYNPADYPPKVRGLFAVEWDFPAVEPPSYLMRLAPDVYRQEQERVAARFEEAVRLAEQAFAAEFGRLVSHLTERLADDPSGERRVFRDTAVGNLTRFFDRFRELSVRSNGDLDDLVGRAQELVRGVRPQDLREDVGLRRHVAREMAAVQTQLDALMVDRPRRSIVRARPSTNGSGHGPGH
jgi:hypothetical protein